jgi:hypothetical protein
MTINWKTWVGAILAAGSSLAEFLGIGSITSEILSLGVALGLWGAGSGVEAIDEIKNTIMKGWKTWMSIGVILVSIILSLSGHIILARAILGVGIGLGVIGITHKSVKIANKFE